MLLRKVFRDLSQRKLRTILTVLGLTVAVIGITGFSVTSYSVAESTKRTYGFYSSGDAILYLREDSLWNASYLQNIDEIEDYEVVLEHYTTIIINNKEQLLNLRGIDINRTGFGESLLGVMLDSGELPDPTKNELLFDTSAANAFDLKIKDTVQVYLPPETDIPQVIDFTITGLGRDIYYFGYAFSSSIMNWLPLSYLQELLGKPTSFNILAIEVADNADPREVTDVVIEQLYENNVFVDHFEILEEYQSFRQDFLSIVNIALSSAAAIGIIIGGMFAANTIQMTIASERKDIALMKVIGSRRHQVFFIYLLEALFFGLVGAIFGLLLSIVGGYILMKILADPLGLPFAIFVVPWHSVLLGILIPILTAIIFSLPVILFVLKISPMEAFRIKAYQKKRESKFSSNLILPKFSWRNLTQKKTRLVLNVIVLSLAIGGAIGFRAGMDSFLLGIDDVFEGIPFHIRLYPHSYENATLVKTTVDNYFQQHHSDEIETYTMLLREWVYLYEGNASDSTAAVNLHGIDVNCSIYESYPSLIDGSRLTPADEGKNHILITKHIVDNLAQGPLTVGSEVTLATPMFNETFTVIGIVDERMFDGRVAYLSLSTCQRFLQGEGRVNTVHIQLKDPTLDTVIARDLSEDPVIQSRGWLVISLSLSHENMKKEYSFFELFANLIGGLGIFVAIIGGMNAFTMSALEREREIGVLKMIGAKPLWIVGNFLLESLFVGLIAGLFGMLLARFLIAPVIVRFGSQFFEVSVRFTYIHIIIGILISITTSLAAGIYPGIRASRTPVISALRYE